MTAYTIIEALRTAKNNRARTPSCMISGNATKSESVAMYKRRKSVDKAAKESVMTATMTGLPIPKVSILQLNKSGGKSVEPSLDTISETGNVSPVSPSGRVSPVN